MYLKPGQWQISLDYRRLTANQWFVGSDVREDKAPFGEPLFLNINSIDLSTFYGVSNRLSLELTLPFSDGTHSRFYADGARHEVSAAGLGDVSLTGNFWLLAPESHENGNVAVRLGIKAPTGKNDVTDDYFVQNGRIRFTVDQSIQLGDGGWGILLQTQAFRQVAQNVYAYAFGTYLISPRKETGVIQSPGTGLHVSVPDVYGGRLGFSYELWPAKGISLGLGGRIEGIPARDVIGGTEGFRRPSRILYVDPAISFALGATSLYINVPVRVYAYFSPDSGGGDLAKYLIFAGVTRRF